MDRAQAEVVYGPIIYQDAEVTVRKKDVSGSFHIFVHPNRTSLIDGHPMERLPLGYVLGSNCLNYTHDKG